MIKNIIKKIINKLKTKKKIETISVDKFYPAKKKNKIKKNRI